jgi:hypothetical protein
VNRNDPAFGSPFGTGLGADGTNGIDSTAGSGLTTLERSAKSLFRGLTIGMQKQSSNQFQFQMNYQLSEDLSDDDNERDPFTRRYTSVSNFKPDYGFFGRDERHRFNAFGLHQTPWGIEFSPLISFHTPQPISFGVVPSDRVLARCRAAWESHGRNNSGCGSCSDKDRHPTSLNTAVLSAVSGITGKLKPHFGQGCASTFCSHSSP